jgi:hypothetical protein
VKEGGRRIWSKRVQVAKLRTRLQVLNGMAKILAGMLVVRVANNMRECLEIQTITSSPAHLDRSLFSLV